MQCRCSFLAQAADVEVLFLVPVKRREVSAATLVCSQCRFVMCSALRLLLILHTSD